MTVTNRLGGLLLASVLALLLLLAACGGDDDDSADNDDGGAVTATESADDDVGEDEDATPEGDDDDDDDNGGGDGGAASEPCSLITEEEIAQVMGEPLPIDDESSNATTYDCTWVADEPSFTTVYLSVYADDQDTLEQYYEFTENAEDVEGLGDRAQWSEGLSVLEILTDGYDISIQIVDFDSESEDTLANASELGEIVLERLTD